MNKRIIIIAFLFCLALTSYSQKILKITTAEEASAKIQDHMEVFIDSTNSLEFDQVSSEEYARHFIPASACKEETSNSNTYWLHFILDYNPLECVEMAMQINWYNL